MSHIKQKKTYAIIWAVIISLLSNGCTFTGYALSPEPPAMGYMDFNNIYLSQNKQSLLLDMNVKGNRMNNYKKERWCAEYPLDVIIENSVILDFNKLELDYEDYKKSITSYRKYNHKNNKYLENLKSLSINKYKIQKNTCDSNLSEIGTPIHFTNINKIRTQFNYHLGIHKLLNDTHLNFTDINDLESIHIITNVGESDTRKKDELYSYFVLVKLKYEKDKYMISKIENPTKQREYNLVKLSTLPFCIMIDIASIPVYAVIGVGLTLYALVTGENPLKM